MWDALGFRESPYSTNPLFARQEDVELLVGRDAEAIELATNLGTAPQGIQVISGPPGVGKTSFFNVQQFKLESGLSPFGPKVLAARHLCPVQPQDDLRDMALRALTSLYKSVEQWSSKVREPMLPETEKIGKWLASTGSTATSIGISIAGFGGSLGRSVQLPKV